MATNLTRSIVLLKLQLQQQDCTDAAYDMRELPGFIFRDVASEHLPFAVTEPFLQHLVSADGIFPDGFRHVAPEGFFVEVNVERMRTPKRRHVLRRLSQILCTLVDGVLLLRS